MSDKPKVKVKVKGPTDHPAVKGLLKALVGQGPQVKPKKVKAESDAQPDSPQEGM